MTGNYHHPDLHGKMERIGVFDRFYRAGNATLETYVTLFLTSDGGRLADIRLGVYLLKDRKRVAWKVPLVEYPPWSQQEAHADALLICGKLGIGLLCFDADRNCRVLADADTATVVVPGSVVLWED